MNIPINVIDLGGGLGIPYKNGQKNLDFKEVNFVLKRVKRSF